ncbi:sensor histidine kinase [Demequina soli]|uniref:sensor histidine kinase n=1 Tax=Demequina soli TaxID=1638987 RepID=UPI000785A9C5|nr:histidine kinase [Demequina soli]
MPPSPSPSPGSRLSVTPDSVTLAARALVTLIALVVVAVAAPAGEFAEVAAALVITIGVWLPAHRWAIALALIAAAPLVDAAASTDPAGVFSMAAFASLVLAVREPRALLIGGVIGASALVGVALNVGAVAPTQEVSPSIALFSVMVLTSVGAAVRATWQSRLDVAARLEAAELARATAVERGVAEERLRIARDLHDSIGHQIAVVSMRIGAAEVALPDDADASARALGEARAAVQAVLRETQDTLRVLRDPSEPEPGAPVPGASTPGASDVVALIETWRDAGMRVDATMDSIGDLSPRVAATVFRIVQESLTNAHRHGAGGADVEVRRLVDGGVRVSVANLRAARVRDLTTPSGGSGVAGMRERARSVGGTLTAQADGSHFQVTAVLPQEEGR